MSDTEKSKEALLAELRSLRQQVAELETGHRVRMGGIATDITERKQAEEELQRSEARYRFEAIYRAQPYAVIITNTNRQISMCNPAFTKIFGYREKEVLGRTTQFLYASDAVYEEMGRQRFNLTAAQKPEPYEVSYRRKNGEVFWSQTVGTLVDDAEGKRLGYLGMIMDITERKQAEEALRERERRLQLALDAAEAGTWHLDLRENRNEWDARSLEIFGLTKEAFGQSFEAWAECVHPEDLPDAVAIFEKALASETTFRADFRIIRPEGDVRFVDVSGLVIRDSQGEPTRVFGLHFDVTEQKQAEEALQESEERLRLVIDAMPAFISYADAEQRYRFVNRHYEKRFGLLRSEIVGRHIEEILGKPTYQAILPHIEGALSGQSLSYETTMEFEGLGRRTLEVAYIPDVGPEGGVRGYYVLALDITERKQAEAEREHFIKALEAKNAELDRFTHTVSHDLKSPLITIKGFLGLLEKDVAKGDAERVRRNIEHINTAADKMQRLLDELLELSRLGRLVGASEEIALSDLAREAADLVAGRIAERDVKVEIDPALPIVMGDRTRLLQVLQNLVDNAVKFMGEQTRPSIEIGMRHTEGESVFFVRDNGMGIEPRHQEEVFGLFKRLDQRIEGTGIGLPLVKRIVEVHGGRIWIESEGLGRGSTFCFTIPEMS